MHTQLWFNWLIFRCFNIIHCNSICYQWWNIFQQNDFR